MKGSRIEFVETGRPDVLRLVDFTPPEPGPGEALIRQTAIGLNFIDTYFRKGLYPTELPSGLGQEAAGVIEAVGAGVEHLKPGDRVAYFLRDPGAYASHRILPTGQLAPLPDGVSEELAAGALGKGLTAHMLLRRVHDLKSDETILVYAAAGGVGSILVPWAKHIGARVIGVVGSEAKIPLARRNGCDEVLLQSAPDFVGRVREITKGAGVTVAYDSVGRDTFTQSLDCLAERGLMVTYGNASGPPPDVNPLDLALRGSLFLTRPTLFHYISSIEEFSAAAAAFLDLVLGGVIEIDIRQRYALADAAQAHTDLEARKLTGLTILTP